MLSFGHIAFMAVGAYTSAILTTFNGYSPWVGLPLAALLAGLVAYQRGVRRWPVAVGMIPGAKSG